MFTWYTYYNIAGLKIRKMYVICSEVSAYQLLPRVGEYRLPIGTLNR